MIIMKKLRYNVLLFALLIIVFGFYDNQEILHSNQQGTFFYLTYFILACIFFANIVYIAIISIITTSTKHVIFFDVYWLLSVGFVFLNDLYYHERISRIIFLVFSSVLKPLFYVPFSGFKFIWGAPIIGNYWSSFWIINSMFIRVSLSMVLVSTIVTVIVVIRKHSVKSNANRNEKV